MGFTTKFTKLDTTYKKFDITTFSIADVFPDTVFSMITYVNKLLDYYVGYATDIKRFILQLNLFFNDIDKIKNELSDGLDTSLKYTGGFGITMVETNDNQNIVMSRLTGTASYGTHGIYVANDTIYYAGVASDYSSITKQDLKDLELIELQDYDFNDNTSFLHTLINFDDELLLTSANSHDDYMDNTKSKSAVYTLPNGNINVFVGYSNDGINAKVEFLKDESDIEFSFYNYKSELKKILFSEILEHLEN